MTVAEILAQFRLDVFDTAQPYLWSDAEVLGYLADAQIMFCKDGVAIRDSSSAAAQIALTANQATAAKHEAIVTILSARLASTGVPVDVLSYADVYLTQHTARALPFSFSSIENKGPVKAIVHDMDDATVKVIQVPAANDTLKLVIERLPLTTPALAVNPTPEVPLEIRKEYHRGLLLRMKELAYGKHDADTYDAQKEKSFGEEWVAFCIKARADKELREHKPRLIQYGG